MIQSLNNLVTDGQTNRRTDGRADGQTERQTRVISYDSVNSVERPIMNIKSCYIHRMLKKVVFKKLLEKKTKYQKSKKY